MNRTSLIWEFILEEKGNFNTTATTSTVSSSDGSSGKVIDRIVVNK